MISYFSPERIPPPKEKACRVEGRIEDPIKTGLEERSPSSLQDTHTSRFEERETILGSDQVEIAGAQTP